MGRHCCPDCEDHPILDEALECCSCGGYYTWIKNETAQSNKQNLKSDDLHIKKTAQKDKGDEDEHI